jgi:hypothetical protein
VVLIAGDFGTVKSAEFPDEVTLHDAADLVGARLSPPR